MTELFELDRSVDLHALHRHAPDTYPFLLQSTASTSTHGRYDILFAFPGDALILERQEIDFLAALDERWRAEAIPTEHHGLPFTGGWFLCLGSELAAQVEPALRLRDDPVLPTAFAVRCPAAVLRDHHSRKCHVILEASVADRAREILADIAAITDCDDAARDRHYALPVASEDAPGLFTDAVRTAREYIAAGDIYQANLSRGWSASVDPGLDENRIYESLCSTNPGPFAGLVRWRDATIISSSPERLLRIRDGIVSTRPIAGTRPRSDDKSVDDSLSAELFANAKERAEHVMLIDLERNDLGRICEPGTVHVDEMMVLETYAHVHHIVSNVEGRLRRDVTPGSAIRAVFPGGTITGCPKVRCMQIIDELEAAPRGAYTGSFGYLNRDGSMDLNILIRTMVMRGDEISFRAGSGIVADSDPDAELAETRAKAEGLLRALAQ
ncbi:MAG: aminodeoxychorismate synthase component I [Woeseiaceae bacterium]